MRPLLKIQYSKKKIKKERKKQVVVSEVLLSMCCFYWLMNKKLVWEEEGGVRETMELPPESDMLSQSKLARGPGTNKQPPTTFVVPTWWTKSM